MQYPIMMQYPIINIRQATVGAIWFDFNPHGHLLFHQRSQSEEGSKNISLYTNSQPTFFQTQTLYVIQCHIDILDHTTIHNRLDELIKHCQ